MRRLLVITGGRDRDDSEARRQVLDALAWLGRDGLLLVGDCPKGVDRVVLEQAVCEGVVFCAANPPSEEVVGSGFGVCFAADWNTQGRKAGNIRNAAMIDYAVSADDSEFDKRVVAIPGNGQGTRHCMAYAMRKGLTITVHERTHPGPRPAAREKRHVMATSRFRRANAPASATPVTTGKPAPRTRRFAGVQAQGDRDPMPYPGTYIFRVTACEEGFNEGSKRRSYKASLEIVEIQQGGKDTPGTEKTHEVGDAVKAIMLETSPGMAEFKRFCMATAGYEVHEQQAYDEWDVAEAGGGAAGDHIEACLGEDNRFVIDGQNPCVGVLVGCEVSYTKPDGKGSYYRRYAWFVVEEEGD